MIIPNLSLVLLKISNKIHIIFPISTFTNERVQILMRDSNYSWVLSYNYLIIPHTIVF